MCRVIVAVLVGSSTCSNQLVTGNIHHKRVLRFELSSYSSHLEKQQTVWFHQRDVFFLSLWYTVLALHSVVADQVTISMVAVLSQPFGSKRLRVQLDATLGSQAA